MALLRAFGVILHYFGPCEEFYGWRSIGSLKLEVLEAFLELVPRLSTLFGDHELSLQIQIAWMEIVFIALSEFAEYSQTRQPRLLHLPLQFREHCHFFAVIALPLPPLAFATVRDALRHIMSRERSSYLMEPTRGSNLRRADPSQRPNVWTPLRQPTLALRCRSDRAEQREGVDFLRLAQRRRRLQPRMPLLCHNSIQLNTVINMYI